MLDLPFFYVLPMVYKTYSPFEAWNVIESFNHCTIKCNLAASNTFNIVNVSLSWRGVEVWLVLKFLITLFLSNVDLGFGIIVTLWLIVFPVYFDSDFKNLKSLEICGGGLTDAGVKNIKDLSSLTVLNLSQNSNLTDKCLEMISGILLKLTSPTFLNGLRKT